MNINSRTLVIACVVFGSFTLAGCDADGPCEVRALDPLFTVISVTDSESGEAIDSIEITDIELDGVAVPATWLDAGADLNQNVTFDAELISCNVPCAFGSVQGNYSFTVDASGYAPTVVSSLEAQFNEATETGCPTILRGGVDMSFELSPE